MADDVPITAGTGTPIAADDIAGVFHQRVKIEYGADGSATDVSPTTPLPVGTPSVVSTNNSSTATLGGAAAFTGTADEVLDYAEARVSVIANVASATDGLSIQQSSDGTNWDFSDVFTIAAATGRVFSIGIVARYLRVVYTNGGGAQGSFRLQTIYHRSRTKPSAQRPGDARTTEIDTEEVSSLASVFDGTNWNRQRGDLNGVNTQGSVAHGVTDAGSPVKVGYKTVAHGSNPAAVTAGQRTDGYANRHGIPFSIGGHPNIITTRLNFTAAQTDVSLTGTINTGTKVVVTGFQVTLDNASTVFPSVRIGFGATNTPTTTGVIGSHPGVPAGGGFGRGDGSGILGVGADGEEVRLTTVGAATGGGMDVVLTYHTIES